MPSRRRTSKTFAGASPDAVKILLAHRPALAREAAKYGVSLQLSGHTHGGMIRGMDLLVARFNGGFAAGRYQVGALQLYFGIRDKLNKAKEA